MAMNYLDIILLIPLLWGLYKGFTKGLIVEAASLIAFGLGVWGAINFSQALANKLKIWVAWETQYLQLIAFAITFLGILIMVFFIAKLVERLAESIALGPLNKAGGAAFGVLKFALMISVLIFVINAIEKSYPFISFKTKEESLLYKPIGKVAPMIIPALDSKKLNHLFPHDKH
jgi:membrane protein required for colicin V production